VVYFCLSASEDEINLVTFKTYYKSMETSIMGGMYYEHSSQPGEKKGQLIGQQLYHILNPQLLILPSIPQPACKIPYDSFRETRLLNYIQHQLLNIYSKCFIIFILLNISLKLQKIHYNSFANHLLHQEKQGAFSSPV
jgi:hypothetical protein